jgi:F-type H+-transporting ATPase subunit epsilon
MKTFRLIVSSPEGNLFDGEAVMLTLRGAAGDLAVMAGHIPFVTTVCPCDCKIETEEEDDRIAHIEGGLLTVSSEMVTLLTGSFVWRKSEEQKVSRD